MSEPNLTAGARHIGGFAELQPHEVLSALDAVGLRGDGRLLALAVGSVWIAVKTDVWRW